VARAPHRRFRRWGFLARISSRHRPCRSGRYWDKKIDANIARNQRVDGELRDAGWVVVRIWDFEVVKTLDEAVFRVLAALRRGSPA
jgi:G:T-mismatch repair DNA endonuclease (very short patch repair protein)